MGVQVLARPDSTLQIVELQNAIGSLWGAAKVGYLIICTVEDRVMCVSCT